MASPFLFGNSPPFYSVYGPASATAPGFLTNGAQTFTGPKTVLGTSNQLVFGVAAGQAGVYGCATDAIIGYGVSVSNNGGTFTATQTKATFIDMNSVPDIRFYIDTGLTATNTFTPTERGRWSATGLHIGAAANPTAALDVTGAAKVSTSISVGASPTAITQIKVYSQTITPASVAANTTAEQDFTVTGLTTADKVTFSPGAAPTAGTGIVGWRVKAADTLSVTYSNNTAGALTPVSSTCLIVATRS